MVADCESLVDALVTHLEHVVDCTFVYNLSTTPHHTFFTAYVAVHNKGGGGGGGYFSGDVLVTVLLKDGSKKCVCMRLWKHGDVMQGTSRDAGYVAYGRRRMLVHAQRCRMSFPTRALKLRAEDASPLCEAQAAAEGDVLLYILTEGHHRGFMSHRVKGNSNLRSIRVLEKRGEGFTWFSIHS